MPITIPLLQILQLVKTSELLTYLSTQAITQDLDWVKWEIDDRVQYLSTDQNRFFHPISKTEKTRVQKELKSWQETQVKLQNLQKKLQEIKTLYQATQLHRPLL